MFKKIILLFGLLVFLTSTIFAPVAQAQSTWYNQGVREWWGKVYNSPENEIFGERYTAAQVQWVFYGTASFFIHLPVHGWPAGEKAVDCLIGRDDILECVGAVKNLFDSVSLKTQEQNLANQVSSRPISFVSYVKSVLKKLNPVQEVSAQGFGYNTNEPLLVLWRASRNIAFAFLIIAVVALAFMIMFRVKINPQTVISVQSAIPRVAIVLVLITFSYAIAGLMIDLMYVVLGLVALIFSSTGTTSLGSIELFNRMNSVGVFWLMVIYWIKFLAGTVFSITTSAFLATPLVFLFGIFLAGPTLLWYFVKIIVMLLKNYALIVLLIIAAPLQILTGAITPGAGFGPWLRSLASKLMVYPLLSLLFLLAFFFMTAGLPDDLVFGIPFGFKGGALRDGVAWDPPLTFGTGGAYGPTLLWVVASYSIIILTPKVVEIIQAMMERKPFPYGTAIGEAMLAPVKGGWGMIQRSPPYRSYQEYSGMLRGGRILQKLAGGGLLPKKAKLGGIIPSRQDIEDLGKAMEEKVTRK